MIPSTAIIKCSNYNPHQLHPTQLRLPLKAVGCEDAAFGDAVVQAAGIGSEQLGTALQPVMTEKDRPLSGRIGSLIGAGEREMVEPEVRHYTHRLERLPGRIHPPPRADLPVLVIVFVVEAVAFE